ncbi:MAG: FlgD immunoglobulin-like domain containing protein [bacterium]
MRPALPLVVVLGLLVGGVPALARPSDGEAAHAQLAADLSSGRLDQDAWLLQSFRYAFAPLRLDPRYRPETYTPLRCITPEIIAFEKARPALSSATVKEIEGYIAPRTAGLRSDYISPGGHFQMTYDTSGTNAVPLADVNPADGVPDFVQRCAEYMDYAWSQEIDTIGFVAPGLPGDGTYDVSFQAMSGVYGYTTQSGTTTRIVLHNTFLGFPNNTDPDGRQLGAAKVTCAHEFKHASEYTTSHWSEGGWVELDATWMEDIVQPQTNDYWNYVNNNGANVLGQPWTSLEDGGSGSYEDCLWQTYLSSSYGVPIIVYLWNTVRAAHPGDGMKKSYQDAMTFYGTDWDHGYSGFLEFAWFTGARALPPFGFPDAPSLKRMNLRNGSAVSTYPFALADSVNYLAGHPFRFNPGTGTPRIQFDGADNFAPFWTLSVILKEPSGTFTIVHPALDANGTCDYLSPLPWSALEYVGVIVTNTKRQATVQPYGLNVLDETAPIGAPLVTSAVDRLVQETPFPNPMRDRARVRFTLPHAARANVRILDVAGRVVRTLVDGERPAGHGEVVWDGRDSAGRLVSAGVYWSRVESGDTSVTRKVTVLR